MKRALAMAVVVLFLTLPATALAEVGAAPSPLGTETHFRFSEATPTAFTLTAKEQLVIQLINKERAKRGLAAVKANVSLVKAARGHSTEMVHQRYFSHNSYSGESFSQRLIRYGYTRSGYTSWGVGECIAAGCGLAGTPQGVVSLWMHSAAHKRVILTSAFREVGVGVHSGSYMNGAFVFTLDFGRRSK